MYLLFLEQTQKTNKHDVGQLNASVEIIVCTLYIISFSIKKMILYNK